MQEIKIKLNNYHKRIRRKTKFSSISIIDFKPAIQYKHNGIFYLHTEANRIKHTEKHLKATFRHEYGFSTTPSQYCIFNSINIYRPIDNKKTITIYNHSSSSLIINRIVFGRKDFKFDDIVYFPLIIKSKSYKELVIRLDPSKIGEIRSELSLVSGKLIHQILLIAYVSRNLTFNHQIHMRILNFFNHVSHSIEIINRIKDDPYYNKRGYGINHPTAERILKKRKSIPGQKFRSISEIDIVYGVGPDTIHDIIYSFQD